jgi:hypothetical protein
MIYPREKFNRPIRMALEANKARGISFSWTVYTWQNCLDDGSARRKAPAYAGQQERREKEKTSTQANELDSKPRSQCSKGRKQNIPYNW